MTYTLEQFAADCRDLIGVPAFAGYPAECNPPPGTCSAGVMCETTLDCLRTTPGHRARQ